MSRIEKGIFLGSSFGQTKKCKSHKKTQDEVNQEAAQSASEQYFTSEDLK
jgi:hypothetical protein